MKSKKLILLMALVAILLSGCRSSRHAQRTDASTSATEQVYPGDTQGNKKSSDKKEADKQKDTKDKDARKTPKATGVNAVTAKLNMTLESGGKHVNVGGTYRLKRDEVIQLNLTYTMIFTVNVGTLELTPDYLLVVDRLNKRFCRVTYDEVPSLAEAGVTFERLQRVFWGEAEPSPTPMFEWTYSDWQPLGKGEFPGRIVFEAKPKKTSYKATIELSNLKENDSWETHTEVSSKYAPISLESVMKALMSVAK